MMDYGKMTPLLVKAVQEQQAQIELLQSENAALKAQVEKITELEAALNKLQKSLSQGE
jgi:prefoldin subunit 5